MRPQWPVRPRPHKSYGRWRRHRKPARQPPRTVLRWSTFPSRSNPSAPAHASNLFPPSNFDESFIAQDWQQYQQRKSKNGKMITLDALEQMHTQPFELVGADACRHGRACSVEISFDHVIGKKAHRHPRHGNVLTQHLAITDEGDGRVKLVRLAGKRTKLLGRAHSTSRFIE